jgi:hypothetical protein
MGDTKQKAKHDALAADAQAALSGNGVFHRWPTQALLAPQGKISIAVRVSNLVIGNMRIVVRDALHRDLISAGYGKDVPPLSTAHQDIFWQFDPALLDTPRYVIWNIWADYARGSDKDERTFEVEVTVRQDDMAWRTRIALVMPADQSSMLVTPNGDFVAIGAPL